MNNIHLPQNVYRLAQKEFEAIPGSPWVYWVKNSVRGLFRILPKLGDIARPKQGLATADNSRFLRYWWEIGKENLLSKVTEFTSAKETSQRWLPYMKGGTVRKWYGNQEYVVNWSDDGKEIRNFFEGDYLRSRPQNTDYYLQEGITWSDLSSTGFAVRYLPPGFVFDVKGSSAFPGAENLFSLMAVMNSSWMSFSLGLLNPTVSFQVGDISRVPFRTPDIVKKPILESLVIYAIHIQHAIAMLDEKTYDFMAPLGSATGLEHMGNRLERFESELNNEVLAIYGISSADHAAIEAELAGESIAEGDVEEGQKPEDVEEAVAERMTQQELAVHWISYTIGIVLGRFQPGMVSRLGSAIYRRSEFAIGSLPAPDEAEFDELVGSADRFAYVDETGGRHVFSSETEKALQNLALPDGIAVFDEGNPRDLPALVEKVLNLMLGEQAAREVIREAVGGDASASLSASLRKFLEKDFFTDWHFKWYRKRPVYWPIQSSKRSYGFVLFHEKISRDTFYVIQREPYLDTRRNSVALKMADVQASLLQATGAGRKKLEKEFDDLHKLSDELAEFAKELEAITMGGYEPEPDWIDDGVILRMAPLWKAIPIWKSEPRKYWERLEAGEFDWSHIAMKYWPERVREKCKVNKSYAIAHGHQEWHQGG